MIKEAGRYIATVAQYGIAKSTGKGTLSLKVEFQIKEPNENVYWDAWITDNTKEKLVENLIETGLLETTDFSDLARGEGLSKTKEVEILVVGEENNGKTYFKVSYVNPIGGRQLKNSINTDEAVILLKGFGLNDQIKLAGKKLGITPGVFKTEDIPF